MGLDAVGRPFARHLDGRPEGIRGLVPRPELVEFARDCELLLVEATLPRPERSGERGHLTAREAAEHGRDAGAKQIVLTHISDELDALWALNEARAAFGGDVALAREGAVFDV